MISNFTLKGLLAFFLVAVAAAMVFRWMAAPPTGDGNQLALLAGFVTLFIKMAADAIGYQFSSSAGSDKKDDTIQKAIGITAPPAPPAAAPPAGGAAVFALVVLASLFAATILSGPAFAQPNLRDVAQRNDVNRPGGQQVVGLLAGRTLKSPDELIKNLQAANLADFRYAKAKAAASKNAITLPCWTAWVDLLERAQAPLVDDKGQALTKPDPHLFSDLEDASELIQALQTGGPVQVGCAAMADAAKKSVAQIISGILTGGGVSGLLPITPLLPIIP